MSEVPMHGHTRMICKSTRNSLIVPFDLTLLHLGKVATLRSPPNTQTSPTNILPALNIPKSITLTHHPYPLSAQARKFEGQEIVFKNSPA